jgi:predicted PurR-regulated permease PerM
MHLKNGELKTYQRTVAIIIVTLLVFLAFLIIRPFLISMIGAAVLAYLFYPTYKNLLHRLPHFKYKESLAAFITVILAILIVLIPMVMLSIALQDEIRSGYNFLKQFLDNPDAKVNHLPPLLKNALPYLWQYRHQLTNFSNQAVSWLPNLLTIIPNVIFNIFITIFSLYFFLKGGTRIYKFMLEFFPLPEGRYQQIFNRFSDISHSMIYGQIVVGMLQGLLACLGFLVLGVPNPVLWGFLTAIISIIPMLGAVMVWLPIVIYLFIIGLPTGVYWKALTLLIYGSLVVSTIDNFMKPKIVGDRAGIHPLIIFFGILGGIQLMGLPGILIGPLVLALFDVVISIFREVV